MTEKEPLLNTVYNDNIIFDSNDSKVPQRQRSLSDDELSTKISINYGNDKNNDKKKKLVAKRNSKTPTNRRNIERVKSNRKYNNNNNNNSNNNNMNTNNDRSNKNERRPYKPKRHDPLHYKLKYYQKLISPAGSSNIDENHDFIRPPAHIIPPALFGLKLPSGKQSSLTTIFAIWNTMMGSSLLTLGWGFSQSGFTTGVILTLAMGIVCLYTCNLVLKHGRGYMDFFDVCKDHLGAWGARMAWIASILILVGAVIAYDRLMSDSLFMVVNGIKAFANHTDSPKHDEEADGLWNLSFTPLVIGIIMFPMVNLKSFDILVSLNTYGVLAVIYMIGFLWYASVFEGGLRPLNAVPHFRSTFPSLSGILSLSFFIHNCILTIMKNQKNPENNSRDLSIAFAMTASCYISVGGMGYLAYKNAPQDFLEVFDARNIGALIARVALCFQLFSVFPLLVFIIRIQFFGYLFDVQYPGFLPVLGLNTLLLTFVTSVSIFYPHVGDVLRFTGSFCGLLYVFMLPVLVDCVKKWKKIHSWWDMKTPIIIAIILISMGLANLIAQFTT